MSVVLSSLAYALAALLALVVVVLATPVRLGLALRFDPVRRFVVSARLLGGLTPALTVLDSARPSKRRRRERKRRKERRRPTARPGRRRALRAVSAAPRLLAELLGVFRLTRCVVDADIGFEDPAATGELYGWIASVKYARPETEKFRVDIRPDFAGERLDGEAAAEISFTPFAFAPPFLRFAWRVYGPRR